MVYFTYSRTHSGCVDPLWHSPLLSPLTHISACVSFALLAAVHIVFVFFRSVGGAWIIDNTADGQQKNPYRPVTFPCRRESIIHEPAQFAKLILQMEICNFNLTPSCNRRRQLRQPTPLDTENKQFTTIISMMPPDELFIAYGQPFNISYVSVVGTTLLAEY